MRSPSCLLLLLLPALPCPAACAVVGYTDLCAQLQPHEVMDLMHRLYSQLDAIIQAMALFKVETGEADRRP